MISLPSAELVERVLGQLLLVSLVHEPIDSGLPAGGAGVQHLSLVPEEPVVHLAGAVDRPPDQAADDQNPAVLEEQNVDNEDSGRRVLDPGPEGLALVGDLYRDEFTYLDVDLRFDSGAAA